MTEFTDRVFVYSNALSTVQYVMYDPIIAGFFWYSVSPSVSGDRIVPSVSATMGFCFESLHEEKSHMNLVKDPTSLEKLFN